MYFIILRIFNQLLNIIKSKFKIIVQNNNTWYIQNFYIITVYIKLKFDIHRFFYMQPLHTSVSITMSPILDS